VIVHKWLPVIIQVIGKKIMEPCFSMSKMQAKSFWTGLYNTSRINLVTGQ